MSHYKPYPVYKDSEVEWLGAVPEHWEVCPLWPIVTVNNDERSPFEDESEEIEYVDISSVTLEAGVSAPTLMLAKDAPSRAQRKAKAGDVVISTVRTYLRAIGRVFPRHESAIFSTGFAIVRAGNKVSPEFLYYALLSETFLSEVEAESTGVSYPAINASEIVKIKCPIPYMLEQEAIARHLDRETARIDALIEKKTRFIELLREKRQALITHAVTKGLNPNVKMKDSGVEWLGAVPEHWGVKPLKLLVKEGSTISYGIVQPGEPLDEGVPFVQTTNMSSGDFDIESLQKTTPEIAAGFPRSRLIGGEVILGIRASIGAAFVVPMHLAGVNLSRGVARIDCASGLSSRFLVAYLSSMAVDGYWQLAKQGSTFNEVSIATVKELLVPVPPSEEQAEIEGMLSNATARLDSILSITERSIDLLKERRSALITAAVTGQIDLREVV